MSSGSELAGQHGLANVVERMDLEDVLGNIKTKGDRGGLCATLYGGRRLSLDASTARSLALRCRVGAVHRINSFASGVRVLVRR